MSYKKEIDYLVVNPHEVYVDSFSKGHHEWEEQEDAGVKHKSYTDKIEMDIKINGESVKLEYNIYKVKEIEYWYETREYVENEGWYIDRETLKLGDQTFIMENGRRKINEGTCIPEHIMNFVNNIISFAENNEFIKEKYIPHPELDEDHSDAEYENEHYDELYGYQEDADLVLRRVDPKNEKEIKKILYSNVESIDAEFCSDEKINAIVKALDSTIITLDDETQHYSKELTSNIKNAYQKVKDDLFEKEKKARLAEETKTLKLFYIPVDILSKNEEFKKKAELDGLSFDKIISLTKILENKKNPSLFLYKLKLKNEDVQEKEIKENLPSDELKGIEKFLDSQKPKENKETKSIRRKP